jgi:16S rRNA C967 or C1407 C5-methylase (RsmB/RsmF family)
MSSLCVIANNSVAVHIAQKSGLFGRKTSTCWRSRTLVSLLPARTVSKMTDSTVNAAVSVSGPSSQAMQESIAGNSKGSKKLSKSKAKEVARQGAVRKAFSEFYTEIYGRERWVRLLEALAAPNRYCCLVNKFAQSEDVASVLSGAMLKPEWRPLSWLPGLRCFVVDHDKEEVPLGTSRRELPFPSPASDFHGIKTHYLLDAASVMAAEALAVEAHHHVLDMCAAPGGKSICVLQRLGTEGRLHANEMSQERRKRLKKVLREYLPQSAFEASVELTGEDASRRGSLCENAYDRVLCDAPCSSERHLLHDLEELMKWTSARTKNLAKRQVPLLVQAIRCAKANGGRILYATCSLSPFENDNVIEKALRKSKSHCAVRTFEHVWAIGERTKFGWIVLPDTPGRWGPLYFCILEKAGARIKEPVFVSSDDQEGAEEESDAHIDSDCS